MNNISIVGRVGKDPEQKQTASGTEVASFSVAVNKRVKNQDGDADWFNVTCFGKTATFVNQYIEKGRLVSVSGRMESRKYEGKMYWDVVANEVNGLDRVKDDAQPKPATQVDDDYDPFLDS